MTELDAIILSDIHLGSDNCEAKALVEFLETIHHGHRPTRRLILNGDVFDSIDFRRLKKSHWKVLSMLRKLSDEIEVVWVNGNHDGPADIVSHLLGVIVTDEYIFETGGKKMMALHGHRFDKFIEKYPITTWIGDTIYRWLQRIDRSHYFAKLAKRRSKIFLRCTEKIEEGAVDYAQKKGCQLVTCGHTHHVVTRTSGNVHYFNSGCWTERPCHYLTVLQGEVTTHEYQEFSPVIEEAVVSPEPTNLIPATP
jgi:UDP-2,3-diacylglucosamine pyrophosphatase LpxH